MVLLKPTSFLPLLVLPLPLLSNAAPTCEDMIITVHAETKVQDISLPPLNLKNINSITGLLGSVLGTAGRLFPLIPASGTYDISARYCEPEVKNENSKTVQVLAHGAAYTKLYWTGLDLPEGEVEKYSWVHYASKQGYATLSLDRLGTGKSTHADPILEVQVNLDAETIHEIIRKLRAGEIKGKRFEKVVFTGHSLGSVIGYILSQRHPKDIDALVLTGWSTALADNVPSILTCNFLPAVAVDMDRWSGRQLGYVTPSNKENFENIFYGPKGTFDRRAQDRAWATRDIVSVGELLTIFTGTDAASSSNFDGPVHVLMGEFDAVMCDNGGKCKDDPNRVPAQNRQLFPNSQNYTYHITPGTGHNLNFHYSARDSYKVAHEFLRYNL